VKPITGVYVNIAFAIAAALVGYLSENALSQPPFSAATAAEVQAIAKWVYGLIQYPALVAAINAGLHAVSSSQAGPLGK